MKPYQLLLTCEHGGNRIPREYAELFRDAEAALGSHRGWDKGALELARLLGRTLDRRLIATTWSRLLVDANRSPSNWRIWSSYTAHLPKHQRARILERWWQPHRKGVERAVVSAMASGKVVHVAVHSFVPEMEGEVRNADVAVLYDSRRKAEARFCNRWIAQLQQADPTLGIRRNYPFLGKADGLTTWLRKRHPESRYLGIELEINQAHVGAPGWRRLQTNVADGLREALA